MGWEVTVSGAKPRDKVILDGLDGTFCSVDTVFVGWNELFVGWNELPSDVLFTEVFGDGVGSFIVQDIELWFEPS